MSPNMERATFGSGCFWCTEAVFSEVKGIEKVVSGYTGGKSESPSYSEIHSNNSGHAEAIQLTFDPAIITFEILLKIFFGTHDPTQLNRQGNDVGEEYRSVIFYHSDEQRQTAKRIKAQLETDGIFNSPIVTAIEPYTVFTEAEEEHKNFYTNNPNQPYCKAIIDPKMAKFRKQYATYLQ